MTHKLLTTGSCACGWTYSEYEFDDFHEGTNTDCTCIHPPASHEEVTGRCLQDNPTFGPCPCEYRAHGDDREAIQAGDYHYYNPR